MPSQCPQLYVHPALSWSFRLRERRCYPKRARPAIQDLSAKRKATRSVDFLAKCDTDWSIFSILTGDFMGNKICSAVKNLFIIDCACLNEQFRS